jgi:hypothetical protein
LVGVSAPADDEADRIRIASLVEATREGLRGVPTLGWLLVLAQAVVALHTCQVLPLLLPPLGRLPCRLLLLHRPRPSAAVPDTVVEMTELDHHLHAKPLAPRPLSLQNEP